MTTMSPDALRTYRCNCGKLLFKGLLLDSTVQIKCRKCGELMSFRESLGPEALNNRYAFMLNRHGDVVSTSSNIRKLLGHESSSLLSMSHDKLSPTAASKDALRSSLGQMWSLHHKERYFFKSKTMYQNKNGELVPGVSQSKFVTTPEDTYLFSVFYANADLADTPVEPEFLQLREYPFLLQVDSDGICTYAHPARKRPFSHRREEIVGRPYGSFLQESMATEQVLLRQLRDGKPFELLRKKYRRANGQTICMDAYFAPNIDASNEVIDYSVYVFDHVLLTDYENYLALNPAV